MSVTGYSVVCCVVYMVNKFVYNLGIGDNDVCESRSGRDAVVSVLALQSKSRWFDPPVLQSFG